MPVSGLMLKPPRVLRPHLTRWGVWGGAQQVGPEQALRGGDAFPSEPYMASQHPAAVPEQMWGRTSSPPHRQEMKLRMGDRLPRSSPALWVEMRWGRQPEEDERRALGITGSYEFFLD